MNDEIYCDDDERTSEMTRDERLSFLLFSSFPLNESSTTLVYVHDRT